MIHYALNHRQLATTLNKQLIFCCRHVTNSTPIGYTVDLRNFWSWKSHVRSVLEKRGHSDLSPTHSRKLNLTAS